MDSCHRWGCNPLGVGTRVCENQLITMPVMVWASLVEHIGCVHALTHLECSVCLARVFVFSIWG